MLTKKHNLLSGGNYERRYYPSSDVNKTKFLRPRPK